MSNPRTDWTVLSMLEWATDYFAEKGVRNPRLSIEWLLAHVLDRKRLDLYLIFDKPLHPTELDAIRPLVVRRANHEPLQYITGETDFFGLPIKVNPSVLIPRQETEQLVELVLEECKGANDLKILDVGTGSGCIALALKSRQPDWNIFGMDISEEALNTARENTTRNNLNIELYEDDLESPTVSISKAPFDVIVSNPPYILESEKSSIDDEVKNFEPNLALFTHSLEKIYSSLEKFSFNTLSDSGFLAIEINERLGEETQRLFPAAKWDTSIQKDYSGKDRIVLAKKLKSSKF